MNTPGFHVYAALEGNLGLEAIREALPAGTPVRSVSLAEAGRPGRSPAGLDQVAAAADGERITAVRSRAVDS